MSKEPCPLCGVEIVDRYVIEDGCMGEQEVVVKTAQIRQRPDFPEIITLCGSSRFREHHEQAQGKLTREGKIVIPMGMYGHCEGLDMDGPVKKMLDELHLRKIDLSHGIFVVNPKVLVCWTCHKPCDTDTLSNLGITVSRCCHAGLDKVPYVGESTRREIEYAKAHGKTVRYLEEMQ